MIKRIKDAIQGKVPLSMKRSSHWPAVREAHLVANPDCENCGGTEKLEVHHKKPFHLFPELELDPTNLITLCESKKNGVNCHLFVGHLGSFKALNPAVVEDAASWNHKLATRDQNSGEGA